MKFHITLIICCLITSGVFAQSSAESVKEKLGVYHTNFPQEKVYIHHDKPQYVLGEKIWYKAYLLDAILHQSLTPSQQVVVQLIDPNDELMSSATIWIEDGGGSGDFQLGPEWATGKYLLRAYTAYQRNFEQSFFFEKEIRVYDAYAQIRNPDLTMEELAETGNRNTSPQEELSTRTLMFFPEGGDLVDGIVTTVGVNAYDQNAIGVKLSATVHDADGELVARFNTHDTGLGFFNIRPEAGQRYTARVMWGQEEVEFDLPSVRNDGYVLRVREKRDTLILTAHTTIENGLEGGFIVGHIRGMLFGIIEGLTGSEAILRIPLSETPDGVLHFTLFKADGSPVSERLKFVYRKENIPEVQLSLAGDNFGKRNEVLVSVASSDTSSGMTLNGSLTVTELELATPHKHASDIRTYLLLESDLRGRIPSPGFFFEDKAASRKLLDVLMLTHGWRRFEWKTLLRDPTVGIDWIPENSLTLKGHTTKYGKPDNPVQARVFISTLSDNFNMQELVTEENGEFVFNGLQGFDTIPLLIQAEVFKEDKAKKDGTKEARSGSKYVDIFIDPVMLPLVSRDEARIDPEIDPGVLEDYFAVSRRTQVVDSAYQDMMSIQLDEVTIQAEKYNPVEEQHKALMLYSEPDHRLVPDSMTGGALAINAFELIRGQFPGVNVVGTFPNYNAIIRGANSISGDTYATYVLDGMVVDVSLINSIPVERIAFIDVLKGIGKSAVYGTGGNGVIAFYSKTAEQMQTSQQVIGSMNYMYSGYYKAKVFYSPDYGAAQDSHEKPDYRTTLYWNPDVRLNALDKKYLTFFTGDKASVYSVRFEGVTSDGAPVVLSGMFEVR
ncbi:MAG: hypothetical protein DRI69_04415 [Bacteroidetes bacterium]|nr:MAG: hypothetical protein DRI69_04415 [Bacteroidota bacterium]